MNGTFQAVVWMSLAASLAMAAEPGPWVAMDSSGHLHYRADERGDRIMDFSSAGYGGGGVALPAVATVETVMPSGGDDGEAIQAAIGRVEVRPLKDGFRGALQLAAGSFSCSTTIRVNKAGVVIRGAGVAKDGTVIELTGKPHRAFELGVFKETKEPDPRRGPHTTITDRYVAAGTDAVKVESAAPFAVGDAVLIVRPITEAWVAFMGMDKLTRDGKAEHWISGLLTTERRITAIKAERIQFDIPLSDSIDAAYLEGKGVEIVKAPANERVAQVGVEDLRIVAPPQHVSLADPVFSAVSFGRVEDGWLRNLAIDDTMETIQTSAASRRITVVNVDINHSTDMTGAALPADFAISGTQTLIDTCHAKGNRLFYVLTGSKTVGPNVVLRCKFEGDGSIMPHQRWATGLLVDSCEVPQGSIELKNRGQMGSGHGWTIGWSVAWNCSAKKFIVQNPPGTLNWSIGCTGKQDLAPMPFGKAPLLPQGEIESPGKAVEPGSLYLTQLAERTKHRE